MRVQRSEIEKTLDLAGFEFDLMVLRVFNDHPPVCHFQFTSTFDLAFPGRYELEPLDSGLEELS